MTAKKTDAPAKTEAREGEISFSFDGVDYIVPPAREWDLDVMESYEDGKIASTCRALLGPGQWAAFRSKKRTVSDLNDLFEAIQKGLGVEGN